jgi:carboxymethylenebutenolidase
VCHGDDSRPPAPPRARAVAEAADLHLTSADGARFMAYVARPERPSGAAAVILPDLRGLHGFYKGFAERMAEAGITAIAIDYFGRELGDGARDGTPEQMMPLVMGLAPEQVAADVAAAVEHLRGLEGVDDVFALGFCFGGSQAWLQSALTPGLAGCIGFYGRPDDVRPFLSRLDTPMLLLAGTEDMLTPAEDFAAFGAELSDVGVDHELVLYDGAPHAFFDVAAAGWVEACADAWERLLAFVAARSSRLERAS